MTQNNKFSLTIARNRLLIARNAERKNPAFPHKNLHERRNALTNPRMTTTKTIELSYFRALTNLIQPLFQITKDRVFPNLKKITDQRKKEMKVDSSGTIITETIEGVDFKFAQIASQQQTKTLVEGFANTISEINKNELDNQFLSVLAVIPMRSEPYLADQISNFVEINASLIKGIPEKFKSDIENILRFGVENGDSNLTIQNKIFQAFGMAQNRAALIATDQTGKFFGRLNELRQKESGILTYFWQSAEDERVRPKLGLPPGTASKIISHRKLNRKKFSWDRPPVSGVNGEKQHPGIPIRCRCVAIPNFEDILQLPLLPQLMIPAAA